MEKYRRDQYHGERHNLIQDRCYESVLTAKDALQVGTHADSLIGEALRKGVTGFDRELAWEALWKDASVPPAHDQNTV